MLVTQSGGFALARAELVALMAHASSDETRAHVNSLCFDVGRGRVAATDGHRLAVCQAQGAPGPRKDVVFLIALADCKAAIRASKAKVHTICFDLLKPPEKDGGVCSVEIRVVDTSVYTDPYADGFPDDLQVRMRPRPVNARFPPIDHIIPRMPHKGQPATSFYAVNAAYLADFALVAKAGFSPSVGGVALYLPDGELDPMFARVRGVGCDWTVLLMPLRDGPDEREAAPEPVEEPAPHARSKVVPFRRPA